MSNLPPLELARATPAALPDVLALVRDCGLLETGVSEALEDFVVAMADGVLLGCAGLEVYGDSGLLRSVAVRKGARGAGLGAALVASTVEHARDKGLGELYLLTTTAAPFFAKRGFRAVPRAEVPAGIAGSWEFRVGCPQTALPMCFGLRTS